MFNQCWQVPLGRVPDLLRGLQLGEEGCAVPPHPLHPPVLGLGDANISDCSSPHPLTLSSNPDLYLSPSKLQYSGGGNNTTSFSAGLLS